MAAQYREGKIVVEDEPSIGKLNEKGFGRMNGGRLLLAPIEALYLMERGTLEVSKDEKRLPLEDAFKLIGKKEKDFELRYAVYKDLRERGYVVKTGFKYGTHFRVYERGKFPDDHSKYLVHVVTETQRLTFNELARAVRLAQGVKKGMIFAVVDDEGDVTYYSVDRITP